MSQSSRFDFFNASPRAGVLFGIFLAILLPAFAVGDPHVEQPIGARETPADGNGRPVATGSESKKQALTLAFIMLASIILGGTLLLAMVVIWGNRTRRLARSPLPEVAKRDDLWFLKPKKDRDRQAADDESGAPVEPDPK